MLKLEVKFKTRNNWILLYLIEYSHKSTILKQNFFSIDISKWSNRKKDLTTAYQEQRLSVYECSNV